MSWQESRGKSLASKASQTIVTIDHEDIAEECAKPAQKSA